MKYILVIHCVFTCVTLCYWHIMCCGRLYLTMVTFVNVLLCLSKAGCVLVLCSVSRKCLLGINVVVKYTVMMCSVWNTWPMHCVVLLCSSMAGCVLVTCLVFYVKQVTTRTAVTTAACSSSQSFLLLTIASQIASPLPWESRYLCLSQLPLDFRTILNCT